MRHARKHAQAMRKIDQPQDDFERREFIARRVACGVSENEAGEEFDRLVEDSEGDEGN